MTVRLLALPLAALVLHLVLIQPNHPAAMTWGALVLFPLELPVILAAMVLAGPGRVGRSLAFALTLALAVVALLKLGDFGTFTAFHRGFDVVVDLPLVAAGWVLLKGTLGLAFASVLMAGATLALAGAMLALRWALLVWARLAPLRGARLAAGVLLVPALLAAGAEIGRARRAWTLPPALNAVLPGAAFTARVAIERAGQIRTTLADVAAFRIAARDDPMAGAPGPFFDRLQGRDLILIYVESYGRASLDNPLYAPTHAGTLVGIGQDLVARGLEVRSGWLRAPMQGGQSWLAHGSVAAGLWLDGQGRYRAFLASGRRTLFHLAQAAGRRSVAIMPAHIFPWPEGAVFGFDVIRNATDLGYAGLPFNFVTMPDQYTLSAFDHLEMRADPQRPPLLAQVALIGSHAPWVPVPPLLAWDSIGDGRIFSPYATEGDPPEMVWRDEARVREQYRLSIDLSLRAIGEWLARQAGPDAPLVLVMGDHQAAPFVAQVGGRDVPLHLIGPPEAVALFAAQGWAPGMIPEPSAPAQPMDRLRDVILRATGSGAP